MTKTRGQAALEFLSTYGFAFLIILVMIGALTYFGVLNPNRFLPERCLMNQEFSCEEFQLDIDNPAAGDLTASVIIRNNLGNSVIVGEGNFSNPEDGGNCVNTPGTTTIPSGGEVTYSCVIPAAESTWPAEGSKVKVAFASNFTEVGNQFSRPIAGEIFGTLQ